MGRDLCPAFGNGKGGLFWASFRLVTPLLVGQLRKGPYLLGERFTAADILWGTALRWIILFKLVPELPEISSYVARVAARPSFAEVSARDAELAARHASAA
jgi:glutathione S-transferase